ncbi:MAG: N-acetyltransferase [Candidatus Firestonebacteria bacterium]|nr:N-acetyltransferase [Candidatus Firestonebacteria bacterium]
MLESWRRRYRESLGVPVIPDFHEALCRWGQAFEIRDAGRAQGYLIFAGETWRRDRGSIIPEFYLSVGSARAAKDMLREAFEKFKPDRVLGRTDDPAGFPLLMDMGLPNQVASPLYVLDTPAAWQEDPEIGLAESSLEDASRLAALYAAAPPEDGGIQEDVALMKSLVAWRHYRLTLTGGEVAAVGYVAPQGGRYVSVHSIVGPAFRGRGLGRYLAGFALNRELSENKIFLATVHSDNEAAKNLIESLGARLAGHFVHFSAEGSVRRD